MSGLLSQFAEFAKTPEGQGLLSAAFGGLAGAQRGAPINSIGRAGLAGLAGYSGALDRQSMEGDRAFQQQQRQMQMDEMKRKQAEAAAQQQWRAGLPGVMKQMEPTYGAGEEGPTMTPGNPNAVNEYLMRPESPFLDDVLKQKFNKPRAVVVGSDFVREQDDGTVKVLHSSQRPESLPSDVKAYNIAVDQGYKGTLMEFMRDRVANTEGAKAGFDIVEITTPDGQTFKVPRSVAATMAGGGSTPTGGVTPPRTGTPRPSGSFQGGGYQGGSAGAAAGQQREILTRELAAAQREGRTQDVAALQRELGRLPGGPGLQVQSKAQEAAAVAAATAEATGETQKRESAKNAQRDSMDAQLSVIDKALNHPGRKTATGLSGSIDPRNYVPGTAARDFQVVLDQLGGAAFLQAFESLKGGGAITEIEGKKATDAMARLNRAQSDAEFEASLKELRGVMEGARKRLGGQSASDAPAPKATMRFNPATGKLEQVR